LPRCGTEDGGRTVVVPPMVRSRRRLPLEPLGERRRLLKLLSKNPRRLGVRGGGDLIPSNEEEDDADAAIGLDPSFSAP
jgi:hypothetical protein